MCITMERRAFTGRFPYTLDPKGRVFIHSRFRGRLGDKFYIMKCMDAKCLALISEEVFDEMSRKFDSVSSTDRKVLALVRALYAGIFECELDAQGRLLIPPELRSYAGLQRDIVVVGANTRVEIWDASTLEGNTVDLAEITPDMLEMVAKYGI